MNKTINNSSDKLKPTKYLIEAIRAAEKEHKEGKLRTFDSVDELIEDMLS